ncbi:OsmC family peroxiredoxin [Agromyces intestinalis]|uniref:OsmC family peroxiredoxin n=1 Tax=Agromyces intestinalis TaxID=2592652 RepID=A0A5C1YLF4_9MICO|nr:OsmC family protein [Agromyces intestinalis]QEO15642.1 OsmC family peroxiredoxin [Agromyces intestinalis]
MTTHQYRTELAWHGSTAAGYAAYSRDHVVSAPPASAALHLSADRAFLGDPALLNPEQLLVAAASSCLLLSFLGEAARAGIDVIGYTDGAEGDLRGGRIATIVLRPRIRVVGAEPGRVEALLREAHEHCFIANSLTSEVSLEPVIEAGVPA